MRHATDPDHVIAVSTIVSRQRKTRSAVLIGVAWGIGHSVTILLVGSGIVLFSWVIPARVGLAMELGVGVMLIGLGLFNLRDLFRLFGRRASTKGEGLERVHTHVHSHGDYIHTHPHRHNPEAHPHGPQQTPVGWLDRTFGGVRLYQLFRPFFIGVVHGLAGSAAVALLVLAAIQNPTWAMVYLFLFGVGTTVGMLLVTLAVALPFTYAGRRPLFATKLRIASGLVSVGFGCLLAYQAGFVHGLFTGTPRWTP